MSTTPTIWLRPNRRVLWLGLTVLMPSLSIALAYGLFSSGWIRWMAALVAVLLGLLSMQCVCLMIQSRLSYANEHLYVRLRPGPPIQVPIDVVECFFLGQGPALLPQTFGGRDKVDETATIVVRLAESAERWKQFDVNPTLGQWCEGYITIRGTWCEPITDELLRHLNENLIAAHRERRARTMHEGADEMARKLSTREQEVG